MCFEAFFFEDSGLDLLVFLFTETRHDMRNEALFVVFEHVIFANDQSCCAKQFHMLDAWTSLTHAFLFCSMHPHKGRV